MPADTGTTATATVAAQNFLEFTAVAVSSSEITVNWTLSVAGAYDVRIAVQTGTEVPPSCALGQVAPPNALSASNYTVSGLAPLTTYSIRACVVETGANENSSPSRTATVITGSPVLPADPINLVASADSPHQITLSWAPAGGVAFGYIISYQAGLSSPLSCSVGSIIAAAAISGLSHSISNLDPGSPYSFRICALDSGATPLVSNGATGAIFTLAGSLGAFVGGFAAPLASPPATVTAGSAADNPILTILWATSPNAQSYQFKACASNACSLGCTDDQATTGTWGRLTSALPQATYFMCVSAVNADGIASAFAASDAFFLDLVPAAPILNMPPSTADYGSFLSVNCLESGLTLRVSSPKLTPNPTVATCTSTGALAIALNWLSNGATVLSVTASDSFPHTSVATTHSLTVALSVTPTITMTRKSGQSAYVNSGDTVQFTAIFSGPVIGFEATDIVQLGTVANLVWSLSTTDQTTFTLQTTVPAALFSGSIRPSIPQNSAHNAAGQNLTTDSSDTVYVAVPTLGLIDYDFAPATSDVAVDTRYPASVAKASARDSNGNLYVIGDIDETALILWKYDANGAAVTAFGTNGVKVYQNIDFTEHYGSAIAFDQSNNLIYVAATFDQAIIGLLCFNATTGALNPNFGDNAGYSLYTDRTSSANAIALHDSAIYVAGSTRHPEDPSLSMATMLKYNLTGTLDEDFGNGTTWESGNGVLHLDNYYDRGGVATAIAIDSGGNIFLTGTVDSQYLPLWKTTTAGDAQEYLPFSTRGYANAITFVSESTYVIGGASFHADTGDQIATLWKFEHTEADGEFFESEVASFGSYGRSVLNDVASSVYAITVGSDGSIYAGGVHTANSPQPAVIWKTFANGLLDQDFGNQGEIEQNDAFNSTIFAMTFLNSALYAFGYYGNQQAMWHYDASSGTSLQSIPAGGYRTVDYESYGTATAVDAEGNIYVTGAIPEPSDGFPIGTIWKYSADGDPDLSFGNSGVVSFGYESQGQAITIDASGSIYVAGTVTFQQHLGLWKLSSNGVFDPDFANGDSFNTINSSVIAIAADSSGNIYVGGNKQSSGALWKLSASTGAFIADFGGGGTYTKTDCEFSAVAIRVGGKIYAAGYCQSDDHISLWTFNSSSGSVESTTTIPGAYSYATAIAVAEDGSILVAGDSYAAADTDTFLTKFLSTGLIDLSFGASGTIIYNLDDNIETNLTQMILGSDGHYYLGGNNYSGSIPSCFIWRVNSVGTMDATFGNNGEFSAPGELSDIARGVPSGRLILTGIRDPNTRTMQVIKVK